MFSLFSWMTGQGSPNMGLERNMGNFCFSHVVVCLGRAAAYGGAGAGHGAYSQPGAVRDDPDGGAALSRSAIHPIRIFQFGFGQCCRTGTGTVTC
jgi:hypothetical protein